MIGRNDELAHLLDAFDATRRERSARTIRVDGPPGVGTSRLLTAFREQLTSRRLEHEWWFGACSRRAGLPFEPFAGLLSQCPGGVSGWLGEVRDMSDEPTVTTILLGGLVTRIREAAAQAPLVLVVDGFDAADASTTQLLDAVGRLSYDAPVLVLLAGRAEFGESSSSTLIRLEPLADDEIRRLVTETGAADVEMIVAASGGRPGVALALAASSGPTNTLARMLTSIDPEAATLVSAIGLADEAVSVHSLVDACDLDPSVLGRLVAHGVVNIGVDIGVDIGVALVDGVWVEAANGLLQQRLEAVAAAVATVLEQVGASSAAAMAWETAGRNELAATAWEAASLSAKDTGAIATAAGWLRRSVDVGGPEVLQRVGHLAASWSVASGEWAEADRLADALLAGLSRGDDLTRMGLLVLRYRACREAGSGDADDFLDAALAIADVSVTPSVERADVLTLDALRLVLDDRRAAVGRGGEALDIAIACGDDAAVAAATAALALAQALAGDVDGALVRFDEALANAERSGDLVTESRIASNKVYVLWRAGRPADVVRVATDELGRLDARNIGWLGDQLGVARAVALTLMGRLDAASAAIESDRSRTRSADANALLTLLSAEIAILRGDTRGAEEQLEKVARALILNDPTVAAEWALQRAELALVRRDLVAARSRAEEGLVAVTADDALAALRLQLTIWRAGGVPANPIDVIPVGRETAALNAEIAAWREGDRQAWLDATSAWEGLPSPINAWRCRVELAKGDRDLRVLDTLRCELDRLSAPGLVKIVDTAIVEAGGRRTVRRIGGPLTQRELEVLSLVAEGFTNREIADRLSISTRTVGVHVEHCLTKLGVSTRGAAVHEARGLGVLNA